jgi:hypothetical protein
MGKIARGLGITLMVLGALLLALGISILSLCLIRPPIIPGGGHLTLRSNLAEEADFLLLTIGGGTALLAAGFKIRSVESRRGG